MMLAGCRTLHAYERLAPIDAVEALAVILERRVVLQYFRDEPGALQSRKQVPPVEAHVIFLPEGLQPSFLVANALVFERLGELVAVRRLENGHAARLQHAKYLLHRGAVVRYMLENVVCDHHAERAVAE